MNDRKPNKHLERTRYARVSSVSCVGEPLKRISVMPHRRINVLLD